MDTAFIFAVIAGIIIIGFAGESLFKKTGIPVFIFLIFIGILLGPLLNLFPRDSILSVLTPFAQLTLVMVLFYGGLGLKASSVVTSGGRAFAQVIIYVISSVVIIGMIGIFVLKWDVLLSFIFASMVAGETTAALIVPLSKSMKLPNPTVAFLTMESAMNSIFDIVLFFAFLELYLTPESSWFTAFSSISLQFSIGLLLGVLPSFAWIFLLNRFQKQKFTYVFTIGLVLITYALAVELGGNGVLAVLVFGIILGNYRLVNRIFRRQMSIDPLKKQLAKFQEEISFLLRTLFFVFLGLTFVINPANITTKLSIAIVLLFVLLSLRIIATRISTYRSKLQNDRDTIILMCAQGLTPATLATLAVTQGIPHANTFLNIVTYIIILTSIVTTVGAIANMRKQNRSVRGSLREIKKVAEEENGKTAMG